MARIQYPITKKVGEVSGLFLFLLVLGLVLEFLRCRFWLGDINERARDAVSCFVSSQKFLRASNELREGSSKKTSSFGRKMANKKDENQVQCGSHPSSEF